MVLGSVLSVPFLGVHNKQRAVVLIVNLYSVSLFTESRVRLLLKQASFDSVLTCYPLWLPVP